MDSILESGWRNHEKPFQEETLAHENLIPVSTLRLILLAIVDYCENLYSNCRLYSFDDWHAHDGYITSRQVTNFHDLHRALESDTALHNSMQGDDFVYKAIYPDTRDFLLRYYVREIEKDDPEHSPGL